MDFNNSVEAFKKAKRYIPGGVNSPVRAFGSVNMDPPFISKGEGSKIYDIDGNKYIDYVCSWGPLILGHRHPKVIEALENTLKTGTSFGAPTEVETKLAKLICEVVPSIEKVRMVNSGTEATMSALRLARGYTNRDIIVKFTGNYHGHSDSLLVKAGSGVITHGIPGSPGVPEDIVKNTISSKYNDIDGLNEIFEKYGDNIAAVIIEPIAGNMGVVPADKEFINFTRKITEKYGSLLIFDEVITGFRVAFKGAQSIYGIKPDITCFGKIIGGGLPVGAYGGKKEVMDKVSPVGDVYQAGTLSGNPLAVTAGLTTLEILRDNPGIYESLEKKGSKLEEGFIKNIEELEVKAVVNRVGSLLCIYFTGQEVKDFDTAVKCDNNKFVRYFEEMLKQGIYLGPSQFEASFVSDAHTSEDIDKTIKANFNALKKLT